MLKSVGPFGKSESFAVNFVNAFTYYATVMDLISWERDVANGLQDPTLPEEVKAQALLDKVEIQNRFSTLRSMTGSNSF